MAPREHRAAYITINTFGLTYMQYTNLYDIWERGMFGDMG